MHFRHIIMIVNGVCLQTSGMNTAKKNQQGSFDNEKATLARLRIAMARCLVAWCFVVQSPHCPSSFVTELLGSMLLEVVYCRVANVQTQYSMQTRFPSMVWEAILHGMPCIHRECDGCLTGVNWQCTDVFCISCEARYECKFTHSLLASISTVNGGVYRGVYEWKHGCVKNVLVVMHRRGVLVFNARDVQINHRKDSRKTSMFLNSRCAMALPSAFTKTLHNRLLEIATLSNSIQKCLDTVESVGYKTRVHIIPNAIDTLIRYLLQTSSSDTPTCSRTRAATFSTIPGNNRNTWARARGGSFSESRHRSSGFRSNRGRGGSFNETRYRSGSNTSQPESFPW